MNINTLITFGEGAEIVSGQFLTAHQVILGHKV